MTPLVTNNIFFTSSVFISLVFASITIKVIWQKISGKIQNKYIVNRIDNIINQPYLSKNKKKEKKKQFLSSLYGDSKKRKQCNFLFSIAFFVLTAFMLLINHKSYILLILFLVYSISMSIINIVFINIKSKKNKKFVADFPDVLDLMARSILSGHSITDAISIVAENTSGILAEEFTNITNNIALGSSLQEALDFSGKHIKISEFHYFIVITYVQQQTGGNIALLLSNLASSLRKKIKVEKKIRALSSEPIASASIIGAIPIVVIGIITIANPEYIAPLIKEQTGQLIMLACILWQIIGVVFMRKIIKVDI